MKLTDALAQIGGFCVCMHYLFGFFASQCNKQLYMSTLIQQRYGMHENTDIDMAGLTGEQYRERFGEAHAAPAAGGDDAEKGGPEPESQRELVNHEEIEFAEKKPAEEKTPEGKEGGQDEL